MHIYYRIFLLFIMAVSFSYSQNTAESVVKLDLLPGEVWWGGAVTLGSKMPFGSEPLEINLHGNNRGNQYAPLLLSSKGRYVWCEKAFIFSIKDNTLQVSSERNTLNHGKPGSHLRDAFCYASKHYFPADGKQPDSALFSAPQYNTWIELMYDQNQRDILKYAHAVIDNGMPPGVLMIDDNWQEDYGKWNFHPGRFIDPHAMILELHNMGFKVMLWVCPFVSADCDVYRALARKNAFFMEKAGDPAMVTWWNGKSAMLDLSNPEAKDWFTAELTRLQAKYGVDGYKLDAGDTSFYKNTYIAHEKLDVNEHAGRFGEIGLAFPLNEYRACWKLAGRPLVQRLRDKNHNWEDLKKLIPDLIAAGLLGYSFVCPDMIGGGEFQSFLDLKAIDQDLVVRSAQTHALAPMMQFSVAPWRVLDAAHLSAVKKAVALRMSFTKSILKLAKDSATSGEPILRPMAYVFPEGGYERINDQFMMGDDLLVVPMISKGKSRKAFIPKGKWKADDGSVVNGPVEINLDVPLERLPYFERM
ncbi:MAG: glycoside hydrolase [Lentisphaerae bacterium RIFOXYA12_FULL_48_11]|nr:MAG: glycoside hydrolase [Lentisphaerae bacterium RIFOXYA12_FULL_48_11]